MMTDFTPTFEIFPGTRKKAPAPVGHDPFDTEEMKEVVPE